MKKILKLALVLVLLGNFTNAQEIPLRVMTFNIRFDNPSDGIYSWSDRKDKVRQVLIAQHPDIIGFQEVLKGQADTLQSMLHGYSWTGVGRDDGKEAGEYCPFFFRSDRFILREHSTFWLSETPDVPGSKSWGAACTRIVTWGCLVEKSTGKAIYVFNTHFDHISEDARRQAAVMLMHSIDSLAGKNPVIVTGDFNSPPGSEAWLTMTGSSMLKLGDSREGMIRPGTPDYTFIGFPAQEKHGEVIDFIFINAYIDIVNYNIVTYNENGLYPSDHLPVVADMVVN